MSQRRGARQRQQDEYEYQPIANLVPAASSGANSFLGIMSIFKLLAILGLSIAILVVLLNHQGAVNTCLTQIKATLADPITTCLNQIKATLQNPIITCLETIKNTLQDPIITCLETIKTCTEYIKTQLNSTVIMESPDCDDYNICTIDYCDQMGGCISRPVKNNPPTICHNYCHNDPLIVKKQSPIRQNGRSVVPNGECRHGICKSDETCKGNCETGEDCPYLLFKEPTACTMDCINSDMCSYHCTFVHDAPWEHTLDGTKFMLEDDDLANTVCRNAFNTTDYITDKIVNNGCIVTDHQLFQPTVVKKSNKAEIAPRNVITQWTLLCQYHFACSTPNPVSGIIV